MYNILVCDDDKEIVDAIYIYLTKEGYNVIKVYDGLSALDVIKSRNDIGLLLVDGQGIVVTDFLAADPAHGFGG